jgi:phage regulator Rha-like protein
MADKLSLVPLERIEQSILLIRGHKVMLDANLAQLYGVPTKVLNQSVKRNNDRFPTDFMFQLNAKEFAILKSQFVTSSQWGGRRIRPYVFTEQGVAMLSSVLNTARAVQVNIEIMRAFVRLREMLLTSKDLARKLDSLERKFESHDVHIRSLFEAIRQLMTPPEATKRKIGFLVKERAARYGRRYRRSF